jgi:hypothetical protein
MAGWVATFAFAGLAAAADAYGGRVQLDAAAA